MKKGLWLPRTVRQRFQAIDQPRPLPTRPAEIRFEVFNPYHEPILIWSWPDDLLLQQGQQRRWATKQNFVCPAGGAVMLPDEFYCMRYECGWEPVHVLRLYGGTKVAELSKTLIAQTQKAARHNCRRAAPI